MGRGTKTLLVGAGAGVAGIAAAGRRRRQGTGAAGGVVAVTVLGSPEEIARAWEGPPAAGDLDLAPAPADRGTEVRLRPGGDDQGAPDDQGDDRDRLRRLKARLEAGEVITTEGQPSGRGPVAEALTAAVSRRLRAWSGS
jgi:hypothetical protein